MIQKPKGTLDILPEEMLLWQHAEGIMRETAHNLKRVDILRRIIAMAGIIFLLMQMSICMIYVLMQRVVVAIRVKGLVEV